MRKPGHGFKSKSTGGDSIRFRFGSSSSSASAESCRRFFSGSGDGTLWTGVGRSDLLKRGKILIGLSFQCFKFKFYFSRNVIN